MSERFTALHKSGDDGIALSLQVDTALKTLDQDADQIVREELELKKLLISSAKALQVRKLDIVTVSEMVKNASILVQQGVKLPLETQMHMAKRMATVSLSDGQLQGWLNSVSCGPMDFDPMKPCFGSIAASLLQEDEQSVLHVRFRETLVETVFCSAFLRALNQASAEQESDATLLISFCVAYLKQVNNEIDLVKEGKARAVINDIARAVRGIVCLTSARAPEASTALEDVRYVVPRNASSAAIISELPKIGRLLVTRFRAEACTQAPK